MKNSNCWLNLTKNYQMTILRFNNIMLKFKIVLIACNKNMMILRLRSMKFIRIIKVFKFRLRTLEKKRETSIKISLFFRNPMSSYSTLTMNLKFKKINCNKTLKREFSNALSNHKSWWSKSRIKKKCHKQLL